MGFSSAFRDPLPGLGPILIESQKTSLATTLDELVRLGNKLGGMDPGGNLAIRSDGVGLGVPSNLSHSSRRILEVSFDLCMRCDSRSTLEPVCEQKFSVVFADSCRI